MNRFETYIRDRQQEAHDVQCDVESALITALAEGDEIAGHVDALASARALTRWWDRVLGEIDGGCGDPVEALWRLREIARHTLTGQPMPRSACPFELGFALARLEAARRFYGETAHLEVLNTRGDAAPMPQSGAQTDGAAS